MRALPATEEKLDVEAYIALRADLNDPERRLAVLFAQAGTIVDPARHSASLWNVDHGDTRRKNSMSMCQNFG